MVQIVKNGNNHNTKKKEKKISGVNMSKKNDMDRWKEKGEGIFR